jgi:hypothetical protein
MTARLRIRLSRQGCRLIDAEGRQVWHTLVLRKRDWPRAWVRALHFRRAVRFGVPSEMAEWEDVGVWSALGFVLVAMM